MHSILLKVNFALCVLIVTAFLTTTVDLVINLWLLLCYQSLRFVPCSRSDSLKGFAVSGVLLSQAITNFTK